MSAWSGLRWMLASVSLVLPLLASAPAQATDGPLILEVQAYCSDGVRVGNAFVVGNWRQSEAGGSGDQARLLLATALHLVHGCQRLTIFEVTCGERGLSKQIWEVPPDSQILLWPGLDLAAFPVPERHEKAFISDGVAVLAGRQEAPPARELVDVRGSSRASVCMGGLGFVLGATNASALASHLARRGGLPAGKREPVRIRGSLARQTRLLQYWGSPTGGTSGAPVTRADDPMTVIGVHQGGVESANVSWAVLLAVDEPQLVTATNAYFGQWSDTPFARPAFSQSAALDAAAMGVQAEAQRWADSQFVITAGVELGSSVVAGLPQLFVAPRLDLSAELVEWPGTRRDYSLAGHAGIGLRLGNATRTFVDPFDTPVEENDVAMSTPWLDLGLELRLRRRARLRPTVRAGLRLGLSALPGPDGVEQSYRLWGVPLELELAMSPGHGYHAVVLRLSAAWEHGPNARYTYTGLGSSLTEAVPDWAGVVALGVGYAY